MNILINAHALTTVYSNYPFLSYEYLPLPVHVNVSMSHAQYKKKEGFCNSCMVSLSEREIHVHVSYKNQSENPLQGNVILYKE